MGRVIKKGIGSKSSVTLEELGKRNDIYKANPLIWIKDIFGENLVEAFRQYTGQEPLTSTGLSLQQENAFNELAKLIDSKLARFHGAKEDDPRWPYMQKMGMSIMAGTGSGKDMLAGLFILYFLDVFKESRIAATANSSKQLKSVLWSQCARLISMSKVVTTPKGEMPILKYKYEFLSDKIYLKEGGGSHTFAEAVTCNAALSAEEQAEVLGGRHAKYMLLVADEASGIPDGVFKPLEGTLTGAVNILFMIFNPTKTSGFAVDSQFSDKDRWVSLRWNSEESELVTKDSIAIIKNKYGMDSNPYRIRVLGLPPLVEQDTLIPYGWIEAAIDRELDVPDSFPVVQGFDVGAGGDQSVIITRHGGKVLSLERKTTPDSDELIKWAKQSFLSKHADTCYIDNIGIGWAVHGALQAEIERLKGNKCRIVAADSRKVASDNTRFAIKRDEMYWNLRTAFEKGHISFPYDRDLIDQLSVIRYDMNTGKVKIKAKDKIKKELKDGGSPDEADALALSYYESDEQMFRKRTFSDDTFEAEDYDPLGRYGRTRELAVA